MSGPRKWAPFSSLRRTPSRVPLSTISDSLSSSVPDSTVVQVIRSIPELVLGSRGSDQYDSLLQLTEQRLMDRIVELLEQQPSTEVAVEILQALSVILASVSGEDSMVLLLSNNWVNRAIVAFPKLSSRDIESAEEITPQFISFLKALSLRLAAKTLPLLFDPRNADFPLFSESARLQRHPDPMVRTSAQHILLQVLKAIVADADQSLRRQFFRGKSHETAALLHDAAAVSLRRLGDLESAREFAEEVNESLLFVGDVLQMKHAEISGRVSDQIIASELFGAAVPALTRMDQEAAAALFLMTQWFLRLRHHRLLSALAAALVGEPLPGAAMQLFARASRKPVLCRRRLVDVIVPFVLLDDERADDEVEDRGDDGDDQRGEERLEKPILATDLNFLFPRASVAGVGEVEEIVFDEQEQPSSPNPVREALLEAILAFSNTKEAANGATPEVRELECVVVQALGLLMAIIRSKFVDKDILLQGGVCLLSVRKNHNLLKALFQAEEQQARTRGIERRGSSFFNSEIVGAIIGVVEQYSLIQIRTLKLACLLLTDLCFHQPNHIELSIENRSRLMATWLASRAWISEMLPIYENSNALEILDVAGLVKQRQEKFDWIKFISDPSSLVRPMYGDSEFFLFKAYQCCSILEELIQLLCPSQYETHFQRFHMNGNWMTKNCSLLPSPMEFYSSSATSLPNGRIIEKFSVVQSKKAYVDGSIMTLALWNDLASLCHVLLLDPLKNEQTPPLVLVPITRVTVVRSSIDSTSLQLFLHVQEEPMISCKYIGTPFAHKQYAKLLDLENTEHFVFNRDDENLLGTWAFYLKMNSQSDADLLYSLIESNQTTAAQSYVSFLQKALHFDESADVNIL